MWAALNTGVIEPKNSCKHTGSQLIMLKIKDVRVTPENTCAFRQERPVHSINNQIYLLIFPACFLVKEQEMKRTRLEPGTAQFSTPCLHTILSFPGSLESSTCVWTRLWSQTASNSRWNPPLHFHSLALTTKKKWPQIPTNKKTRRRDVKSDHKRSLETL